MADTRPEVDRTVRLWRSEIERAKKHFDTWTRKGKQIVRRYRDERDGTDEQTPRFNILWSNVQTLIPALYSLPPKPIVSRRYLDKDPVGRLASQVLQRALTYQMEQGALHEAMRLAVEDYLLPGRGQVWVRYEAKTVDEPVIDENGMPVLAEDATPIVNTRIESETVFVDYIAWQDFLHSPARTWEEVRWCAKRAYMSRAQLIERFGEEIGKAVPTNCGPDPIEGESKGKSDFEELNQAGVWEIWNKDEKRVIWIADDFHSPLDEKDDPLQLAEFFPCPKPAFATTTTDSLIPVPDYAQYQAQAVEIDDISARIDGLVSSAKLRGVYDQSQPALARLFSGVAETDLIPVENWAAFATSGGLKGSIDFVPIEPIVNTLRVLYENRQSVKADIYEITGLSDIIRGQAQGARATATEQRIKGQFATLRLQDRQSEVSRLARDALRIVGEILCEQFQPQTLAEMTGIEEMEGVMVDGPPVAGPDGQPAPGPKVFNAQLFEEATTLLRNERLRGFRIDIETDSTIQPDEEADKASRVEFMGSVGSFLQTSLPAIQQEPKLAPLLGKMLLFGVRGFRAGRELEGALEDAVAQLEQAVAQPQQPQAPPPDPKAEALKAQMEIKGAQAQQDMQIQQEEHAAEMEARQQDQQMRTIEFQGDMQRQAVEIETRRQRLMNGGTA